jgi:hypothetical protein
MYTTPGLRLRLDAGIEDGNSSSSSRARFLRLPFAKPRFAADMLGRNGELPPSRQSQPWLAQYGVRSMIEQIVT